MTNTFSRIAVVGAGTMGHGIAQVAAMAGFQITLIDKNAGLLDRGLNRIQQNLDKGVSVGKVSIDTRNKALNLIQCSFQIEALSDSDLMIEAIVEDMAAKKKLFQEADRLMHRNAILASNTSSLSIQEIGASTKRPEQVIGLHFFNPVHIMKLIEIIRTKKTSPQTVTRARNFASQLKKDPILINDSPGFATSRLGICFALEAIRMVETGVGSIEDIDRAMVLGYGHPMGPLKLTDLVGLDVRLAISKTLCETLDSAAFSPPALLEKLVKRGSLGKKTESGFYVWDGHRAMHPSDI